LKDENEALEEKVDNLENDYFTLQAEKKKLGDDLKRSRKKVKVLAGRLAERSKPISQA